MKCAHPDIANMDHVRGYPPDQEQMVNRCCRKCWAHWAGPEGAVVEYTKAEWYADLAEAWSLDRI